jgi:hypothetical protein
VHRVAQWLGLVERRSVSKGVDRIVVGHPSVAEDGAPPPHPQSLVPLRPPGPSAPPRSATRRERQPSRRRATRPSHQHPRRRGSHANPARSCSSSKSSGERLPIGVRSHVIARRTPEISCEAPICSASSASSPCSGARPCYRHWRTYDFRAT